MAAAIIPVASAIVPMVMPYVAKLMDKLFGNGTGVVRLATGV